MKRLLSLLALALLFTQATSPQAQDLTEKNYKQVRDHVLPTKEEVEWREIPWRVTLWDAVCDAQKEDKPILLFAMNGHPFGCT
jgi:hypothetical protein